MFEIKREVPYLFSNMTDDNFRYVLDPAEKIKTLQNALSTLTGGEDATMPYHEYFEFSIDTPSQTFAPSVTYLEGDLTIIPFFGMYLETKSGYIVSEKGDRPIVLGNLFDRLRVAFKGFDPNEFIYRIEQYYLGNIATAKELFEFPIEVTEIDPTKSYLYQLVNLTSETSKQSFDIKIMLNYLKALNSIEKWFSRAIARSLPEVQSDLGGGRFEVLEDLSLVSRYAHFRQDEQIADFYSAMISPSFDLNKYYLDGLFNHDYLEMPHTKISKSERNYLCMLPLIEASDDSEMKCYATLLGEKQEIIESIKSSKFKEVIKGAFLKGVITKKNEILATVQNLKHTDKANSVAYNMYKNFIVLLKYFAVFDTKVVKDKI